ncbi:MAG: carotenoid 1,2-hydratase [Chloroflexi bacterium]|nr:carotenoid 1,2-hydratase [Chloroflexota bacterium]
MKLNLAQLLIAAALTLSACASAPTSAPAVGRLEMQPVQTNPGAFTRATTVRDMHWPEDHGPHDEYLLEWWYYTGNVQDASGRPFGYQLTVFRRAVVPPSPGDATATNGLGFRQVYFAHFALSDIEAGTHHAFERFSRGAGGLAGAQSAPFRAWVENWTIDQNASAEPHNAAGAVQLRAEDGNVAIDLSLQPDKPLVLQADRGLSPKSADPKNASYYYSFTRLSTNGRIRIGEREFQVTGSSWMDHEWSTSLLDQNAEGWDWLALQLDDGHELLIAQVRDKSRRPQDAFLALATLIEPDGKPRQLKRDELHFEPLQEWRSPHTGASYPTRWRVTAPSAQLDLEVRTRFDDQEAELSTVYYEGAVSAEGTVLSKTVHGVGYLEMTGYSASIGTQLR